MRPLANIRPTPEQLTIVSRNRPGTEIIRGAAGSGKTSTALLRLRSLIGMFTSRNRRMGQTEPVRALVLTFNRTLRGYIETLAREQTRGTDLIDLEISTFARWAKENLGNPRILNNGRRTTRIATLGSRIALERDFLVEEVDYIMGRLMPANFVQYLTIRRDGRGASPRVARPLRNMILDNVINPYQAWKQDNGWSDWNDLAVNMAETRLAEPYDIVIADETQDFSANQIRAIRNQLADVHCLTLVVDTAQRIYARGFTWQEVGITVASGNSRRLVRNYRNTIEIAKFVAPLIEGIPIDDDATIPDFTQCNRHGPVPVVLKGRFSGQTAYVVNHIRNQIDLREQSVAFLHPLGGGWFRFVKEALEQADMEFVEITRQFEWPEGDENIALSTLHSSKGLEFDHVVILGLNSEVTPHGDDQEDDRLMKLRRLLAMGIGRACESVILGYRPQDASKLISYLDPDTFQEVEV